MLLFCLANIPSRLVRHDLIIIAMYSFTSYLYSKFTRPLILLVWCKQVRRYNKRVKVLVTTQKCYPRGHCCFLMISLERKRENKVINNCNYSLLSYNAQFFFFVRVCILFIPILIRIKKSFVYLEV